jgi:phospholipid-translocating ATPase
MIEEANSDVLNRNTRLADVYKQIETKLTILGVTAVEDKLQEEVENTLSELRLAGIKIWVLTGDKLETAINISDSCHHFSPDMVKFVMKELKNPKEIQENLDIVKEK